MVLVRARWFRTACLLVLTLSAGVSTAEATLPDWCTDGSPSVGIGEIQTISAVLPCGDAPSGPLGNQSPSACHCVHSHVLGVPVVAAPAEASPFTPTPTLTPTPHLYGRALTPPVPPPLP